MKEYNPKQIRRITIMMIIGNICLISLVAIQFVRNYNGANHSASNESQIIHSTNELIQVKAEQPPALVVKGGMDL